MPTYQYSCTECGHFFEQFQSFTDDALTECPECQGRLRKVFNAVGVVFKGSGFYRNDSRATTTSSESGSSSSGTSSGTSTSSSGSTPGSSEKTSSSSEKKSGGDAKSSSSKSDSAA